MVVQQEEQIRGNTFTHSFSDSGFYIERDGVKYADAYDLPQFQYTYTETNEPLEPETAQEIMALANND